MLQEIQIGTGKGNPTHTPQSKSIYWMEGVIDRMG